MSWSKDRGSSKRRGYHHGNLKEALIEAARDLIGEKGPAGFTFAEAARFAGVSAAAPYRHFRDRDELIAEVAARGFERFETALTRAWNGGAPNAYAAYDRIGRAYLAFARDEPAYFSAMFESGLAVEPGTSLGRASERAFNVLRDATAVLCEELPAENRPPVMMMSLHIWSLSHGIATLFGRGDSARRKTPISPEDLLESAVLIYLQGLGFAGPDGKPPDPR
ncbi:MAG: TetR/AcrR family transcriptional regulator [Hyphomicrobiaceae bacterium]